MRLGPYEIIAAIGVGGMGEVYRARDTRLNRDVAIKVLPELFAADPERLGRFEREAQVLASLNHPNIATIHGLELADPSPGSGQPTVRALAMELVEGEDLAQRIARGAVPLDEALPIARQIAEALEAAHEHSIVHRDLKPGNVKVREDGTVKVLDFGLAKALVPDVGAAPSAHLSLSPTLTSPIAMTGVGVLLGTAAYMSPEQAVGRLADKRSDVWAFGVVLLEMLTGRPVFTGETVSHVLADVLRAEIDFRKLPASTPTPIRELLKRCLDRDVKTRLRDIGEARVAIQRWLANPVETRVEASRVPARSQALYWAAIAVLGVAATGLTFLLWAASGPAAQPEQPLRLSVELGADASLVTDSGPNAGGGAAAVLSPDGSVLAFVAGQAAGDASQLYVRRLDQLAAAPLMGTESARHPFFSPDGQWVAFFAGGKLKKVAATGGAVVTLCDAPGDRGGTWSEDGSILFAQQGGLWRVSSAGGAAEVLTTPNPAAEGSRHSWPQALPGGKAVLFTAYGTGSNLDDAILAANLVVQRLPGGPRKIVRRGGNYGRYLPSGHLVFMREGTLFAAPFDVDRLETTGPPAPALEGVMAREGGAQFSFSSRGTLVFVPGPTGAGAVPIHWMDAQGNLTPLRAVAADYRMIRFSPDGGRLSMSIRQGTQQDVWVYEWERGTLSRLTSDASYDAFPVWTPNGQGIAFASLRADKATRNLYWQRADGTGEAERLIDSANGQIPTSWHPSGKFLAFTETHPQTRSDIMILPLEGDEVSGWKPGRPSVFLNTPFNESFSTFSPDGRWLAYQSDESGTVEVYVRPFPGPGGKWRVSTAGGENPVWSRNGRELFYRSGAQSGEQIWVASYAVQGDAFRAEKPRVWSPGRVPRTSGAAWFDLHPDGQRFAVVKAAEETEVRRDKVVFITNFFDELRRIAPTAPR